MTTKLLLYVALLTASGGLAFAATRILRTNRSIATVWPDWEGIKSTAPLWIALALALCCLSIAAAFVPEKPAETPKIPQPQIENPEHEKELAKLRNQINELKQKESDPPTQSTPISPSAAPTPTKDAPEKPRQTAAKTPLSIQQQPNPPSPETQKPAPSSVEQLRQTVIQALITGPTKSLETVAHKTLLNLLANQLTVNPFHYSNLQSSLKYRLRNGYASVYLDALNAANGTTYLWKIKTTAPGPDILQKLTVSNGKITAFHFDNLR